MKHEESLWRTRPDPRLVFQSNVHWLKPRYTQSPRRNPLDPILIVTAVASIIGGGLVFFLLKGWLE